MNRFTRFSFQMLIIFTSQIMVSCGGGDDAPEPVEAITEEEYNLRQVCEIFGINRNDYDRISGRGIDGVNVFAFHNKNNNILFIGAYNPDTKKVLFRNSEVTVNYTEKLQYYETTYDCEMSNAGFDLVKKDNGLFLVVDVWYGAGYGIREICKPIVYIYNGSMTRVISVNKLLNDPARLIDWYNDACIVSIDKEYTCYTINADPKYTFKDNEASSFINHTNIYHLSYEESLVPEFDIDQHKLTIRRVKFSGDGNVISKSLSLFEDMPNNTKTSISLTKGTDGVTITVKAVAMDGKTETAQLLYNLNTNELTKVK